MQPGVGKRALGDCVLGSVFVDGRDSVEAVRPERTTSRANMRTDSFTISNPHRNLLSYADMRHDGSVLGVKVTKIYYSYTYTLHKQLDY